MIGRGISYSSIIGQGIYSSFNRENMNHENAETFEYVVLTQEKSCLVLFRCRYHRKSDPEVIEVLDVYSTYDRDFALESATRL